MKNDEQKTTHALARSRSNVRLGLCISNGMNFNLCRKVFFVGGMWRSALGLFLIGWILQFVGHYFEGKPPEFMKDYRFLFVGMRWWMKKTLG